MKPKPKRSAYEVALGLLARREHSGFELQTKLGMRKFDAQEIQAVCETLAQQNWQSDARYAEMYVYSRVQKGYGPVRLRYELNQRGVSEVLIDQALQGYQSQWLGFAQAARCKRFGMALPQSWEDKAKQWQFLVNRGFAAEQINAAFEVFDEHSTD